jgi:hypothetical protein
MNKIIIGQFYQHHKNHSYYRLKGIAQNIGRHGKLEPMAIIVETTRLPNIYNADRESWERFPWFTLSLKEFSETVKEDGCEVPKFKLLEKN